MQAHIHHLRSVADSRSALKQERAASSHLQVNFHRHTRQKSSDVFGPPATEILQLQLSTCDFWARCVNMYLDRTTDRIKNSVRLHLEKPPFPAQGTKRDIHKKPNANDHKNRPTA